MFQKISGSEKFMDDRGGGGGVSRFSVDIFCLCQKKSKETLPGFRKILVSKLFMHKRGVIAIFRRNI